MSIGDLLKANLDFQVGFYFFLNKEKNIRIQNILNINSEPCS